MSRINKVNKDSYSQRGRLTPDEMGRERMKQAQVQGRSQPGKSVPGKAPSGRAVRTSSRPRTPGRKSD